MEMSMSKQLDLVDSAQSAARDLVGLAEILTSGEGSLSAEARELISKGLEAEAVALRAAAKACLESAQAE